MARNRSSMGRTNQNKGKRFQHIVARILAYATRLDPSDFTSNHGGVRGEEDICQSREAQRRWPWRTETKNTQKLQLPNWIAKLDQDAKETGSSVPGLVCYKLYGTSRIRVDLDLIDFLDMAYGPLSSEEKEHIRLLAQGKTP